MEADDGMLMGALLLLLPLSSSLSLAEELVLSPSLLSESLLLLLEALPELSLPEALLPELPELLAAALLLEEAVLAGGCTLSTVSRGSWITG